MTRQYSKVFVLFVVLITTWMGSLEAQEGQGNNASLPSHLTSYISKAYHAVWTNNFLKDALHTTSSHVKIKNLQWFVPNTSINCKNVPRELNKGAITSVVCRGRGAEERICVCVKLPHSLGGDFHHLCGQCEDPCALHFNAFLN
ncbi:unnamed protein product [Lepeophtheirus salmonis]|uniref:(salmon louse) hypothetical protein n=2 Tax=Lepeophtheirus salmonis TaxID=72036 RepID=A0A7R8CB98_LEPSM|nr:unnamed protein product [Lepeophtheirus salmonis]CAF2758618.1 unnamed protein product [Lepeophtheirus salmonis]